MPTDGRTDSHDEANSRLFAILQTRLKTDEAGEPPKKCNAVSDRIAERWCEPGRKIFLRTSQQGHCHGARRELLR